MKILIVEDEKIIALTVEQLVNKMGHEVVDKISTGEEAVKKAVRLRPDLILMDIRLEGRIDGIKAVSMINKKIKIPVIYITGNTGPHNKRRAKEAGFVDFLAKPVVQHDLLKSLKLLR